MMYGLGTDLVCVSEFGAQLSTPGTRFAAVFSAAELRVAASRRDVGERRYHEHLAGRWAAKEAFVKAWSQALYGHPPVIAEEDLDWAEIEVQPDAWGRVALGLRGDVARQLRETVGKCQAQLSISHDGDYATATVILYAPVATENK